MAEDACSRVTALELLQQGFEGRKLRRGEVVFRFVIGIYATGQTDADGVAVMASHMGTDGAFRASGFQLAIAADDVVIAHGVEAALDMPLGDFTHADICRGAGGGAVDDDKLGAGPILEC